jgi:Fic family protein
MPARIPEHTLVAIEKVVAQFKDGAGLGEITKGLTSNVAPRTLQYRLKYLVENGRLTKKGEGSRWTRYSVPATPPEITAAPTPQESPSASAQKAEVIPLSPASQEIRAYVSQPVTARKPVGYRRQYLDSYRPNETFYLSEAQRTHLAEVGKPNFANTAAGTYAKHILSRLLIDLSWNSSRLEGNTYSLLETKRLIELGEENVGTDRREAQMIINHKQAIEFLVNAADDIGFNRYTILNLHGILAQNLLPDPAAPGRLRRMAVGIEQSAFRPLEVPQIIEECFTQVLNAAAAIEDPFEQSLFAMVQLPYLQPFDDVNKRVSRLAANIPFIKRNLSPLSFTDVPRDLYTNAILGVYERNQVDLLRDVYIWAYERSADVYAAVRQSLGEPDPFHFKYRTALHQVVADVVRGSMNQAAASAYINLWAEQNVPDADREQFRTNAEVELLTLHEGNFARYQIRLSEFAVWQQLWNENPGKLGPPSN